MQGQGTSIKMTKRPLDANKNKMSKTDRFVQMSQQEMLIEQKKREIQAKLEAKRRQNHLESKEKIAKPPSVDLTAQAKDASKSGVNLYSNDGSFLDQFKQLKDKKNDSKFKTFLKYKEKEREKEKEQGKDQEKEEEKDVSQEVDENAASQEKNVEDIISSTPDLQKPPPSIADRLPNLDPQKLTFDTSFVNTLPPNHFNQEAQISQAQQGLDSMDSTIYGPPPASTHIPPLLSEFTVPAQLNFESTDSISHITHLSALGPQMNANDASTTAQLITSTVTQQLAPATTLPALIQQPVGIVASALPDMTMPAPQIGPANLSSAGPALQQTPTVMTQALAPPTLFATTTGAEQIVSAPPQVLLNVPPPQILPQTQLVITPQEQNVLVSTPATILTTVTLPPPGIISPQNINVSAPNALNVRPPGLSTVELTSIPPPNPIQVHNIPQPEPLNTLTIPSPAPLQVSNIPTPSSLQLNKIPNPKPLDLMAIPTPSDNDNSFSDTNFLKNIPPPNKSLPPPNVSEINFLGVPPQLASGPSSLPSLPPTTLPQSSVTRIPSLMSKRVLPPPGMAVNIPPPMIPPRDVSQPPPNFSREPPPQLPNINVPPPVIGPPGVVAPHIAGFKDEIVSGGAEFEAMANLARMVAECGPSVEDVVRQKKNRDPELWFLFHKDSPAYRQYASLVEQYKREREDKEEMERKERKHDPSEIYEPEMALEDDDNEQDNRADWKEGNEDDWSQDNRDEWKQESRDDARQESRDNWKHDTGEDWQQDTRDKWKQDSRDSWKHDRDDWKQNSTDKWKQDSRDSWMQDRDDWKRESDDWEEQRNDWKQDKNDRKQDRDEWKSDSREKWKPDSRESWKQDRDDWKQERDDWKQQRNDWKQDRDDRKQARDDWKPESRDKWNEDLRHNWNNENKDNWKHEPSNDQKQGCNYDWKINQDIKQEESAESAERRRERKRKSRWGEKDHDVQPPITLPVIVPPIVTIIPPVPGVSPMLSRVTRTDPGLLQYAIQNYGSANLSDEDWKKAEDNYKVHLLYQDMLRKREELQKLEAQGKKKYEYDSDEETEGGTWEHKLREKEMMATEIWATELTRQAEGKHHIGDFLPPEELKRFMENSNALKEGRQPNFSDYKEFKIKEDNIGFKMLQKLGWNEGQGLGQNNTGIVEPINKGAPREHTQGLGLNVNEATEDEDEYESYRKRMMLAYRFRPNPLNNPRRPYY